MSAAEKKHESPDPFLLRGNPLPAPAIIIFPFETLGFIPSKLSSSTQDKQSGCLSTEKEKKEKRTHSRDINTRPVLQGNRSLLSHTITMNGELEIITLVL